MYRRHLGTGQPRRSSTKLNIPNIKKDRKLAKVFAIACLESREELRVVNEEIAKKQKQLADLLKMKKELDRKVVDYKNWANLFSHSYLFSKVKGSKPRECQ